MRILILAAGRQDKWLESGGNGYKQLVEIDGEPIIHRTFRLASERADDVLTVVPDPQHSRWRGLNPRQAKPEDWMYGQSKLLQHRHLWGDQEILLVPGDAYLTERTFDLMVGYELERITIFGRAIAADRRPEAFGFRFAPEHQAEVVQVARSCVEAGLHDRKGAEWRWFLHKHTMTATYRRGEALQEVRRLAKQHNGWVELPADETEDFDRLHHVEAWRRRWRLR